MTPTPRPEPTLATPQQLEAACRVLSERTGRRHICHMKGVGPDSRVTAIERVQGSYRSYKPFPESLDSMRLLLDVLTADEWINFIVRLTHIMAEKDDYLNIRILLLLSPSELFTAWCAAVGIETGGIG